MYQQLEVEPESNERAFQEVSAAAYPQLCGCWLGDEWPENMPGEQPGGHLNLCPGSSGVYANEIWSQGTV